MNASIFRLSTFETGQFVDFEEIVCFVADGNYSFIYLKDGSNLLVSKCLECLEQRVPENSFLRIHKSYLVNPHFVECVFDKQIKLTNGIKLRSLSLKLRQDKKFRTTTQVVIGIQ